MLQSEPQMQTRIESLPPRFVHTINLLYAGDTEAFINEFATSGEEFQVQSLQNESLTCENARLRQSVSALEQTLSSRVSVEQLEVLQQENVRSKQDVDALRAQLAQSVQERESLEERYDSKLGEKLREIIQLQEDVRQRDLQLSSMREEMSQLKETAEKLTELQAENTRLQQDAMEHASQVRGLQSQLDSVLEDHKLATQTGYKLRENLAQSLAALKEHDASVARNQQLQQELEKASDALRCKEEEATALRQERDALSESLIKAEFAEGVRRKLKQSGKTRAGASQLSGNSAPDGSPETLGLSDVQIESVAINTAPNERLPFPEVLFGKLQAAEQSDLRHAVFLLLNQNYCLSNLLSQEFQGSGGVVSQLQSQLNSPDQMALNRRLLTALENFRDLFVERRYVQSTLERVLGGQTAAQEQHQQHQNSEEIKALVEAETYLLRKKLQIENSVLPRSEELLSSKHALAVVYYQSLCKVYEALLRKGVSEFVKFRAARPCVPTDARGVEKAGANFEAAAVFRALEELTLLVEKKADLAEIRGALGSMSALPQRRIALSKGAYQEELRGILNALRADVSRDPRQVLGKREPQLDSVYLRHAVGSLQAVLVQLLQTLPSENNRENLHLLVEETRAERDRLALRLREAEAKQAQVREIAEGLQEQLAAALEELKATFQTLYAALDCTKLEKLQQIVEKQQKIIAKQQADLQAIAHTRTATAEVQADSITLDLRELQDARRGLRDCRREKEALEEALRGAERALGEARQAEAGQRAALYQALSGIRGLEGHAAQQGTACGRALFQLERKIGASQAKTQALGAVFARQTVLVARQREFIEAMEAVQRRDAAAQAGSPALEARAETTATEPPPPTAERPVQCAPKTDSQAAQTEFECQECTRILPALLIERHLRAEAEAQLQKATTDAAKLQEQYADLVKQSKLLSKLKLKERDLQRKIEQLEAEFTAASGKADTAEAERQRLADELQKTQLRNTDLAGKLRDRLQTVANLEKQIEENKAAAVELPAIKKQCLKLQRELAQARRLMEEQNAAHEKLAAQAQELMEEAKKKTKKRKLAPEDRVKAASILSQDDLDAIFDV